MTGLTTTASGLEANWMPSCIYFPKSSCGNCPYSDSSIDRKENKVPVIWYCNLKAGPEIIEDFNKIDSRCPLKIKSKKSLDVRLPKESLNNFDFGNY